MSDKTVVIRQLTLMKTMEQWPMEYPGTTIDVSAIAECIMTSATYTRDNADLINPSVAEITTSKPFHQTQ